MYVGTLDSLQGVWNHRRIQEGGYDVCMGAPVGGVAIRRDPAGPLKNSRNSYPALLMYVCMYVCMYVVYVCMYVVYVCMHVVYVCSVLEFSDVKMCIYVCMCMYVYLCMYMKR